MGKRRAQFQCNNCGHLHWVDDPPDIDEGELYVKLRCGNCKQTVNHLWVGTREEDKYLYYDVTKDERFY